MGSTSAIISHAAYRHNVAAFSAGLPSGCALMAVIKADAYGHGAATIGRWAQQAGAKWLCVARAAEAQQLRDAGITLPVLILQPALDEAEVLSPLCHRDVAFCAGSLQHLQMLRQVAQKAGGPLSVHLKLDTGMHRIGFDLSQLPEAAALFADGLLQLDGLFTHFACADTDPAFTHTQYQRFLQGAQALNQLGFKPMLHASNTAATLNFKDMHLDGVRVGLGLYGYAHKPAGLQPVLSWRAPIVQIHQLQPGEGVSYGWTFVAQKPTRAATVGVGYADGFARRLSNGQGQVLLHGKRVPVLGTVCMDQIIIDVTDLPQAQIGDDVWLLGGGENGVTAEQMADWCGTICYEVLCGIAPRVLREYRED